VEPYLSRCGAYSVEFFMSAFGDSKAGKLVADRGLEFIHGDVPTLLKLEG